MLPIVEALNAFAQFITTFRQTMSQENRDRFDLLLITSFERGDRFWTLLTAPIMRALEKANEGK